MGSSFEQLLLTCFKYDPATRRYGPYLFGFLRGGALLVFFALVGLLTVLWRRELKMKKGLVA